MPRFVRALLPITAVVMAPLVLLAAAVGVDRAIGSPQVHNGAVIRIELPPAGGSINLPRIDGPLDASRPLVVIDAGHGGHDPGAGAASPKEKDVTLGLALALRARLLADGGIRVALTREDDRYLMLEERSGLARRLRADLFISIHADSADTPDASGATVYTLSSKGTSEEASRLAASENRADSVNGVALASTAAQVSSILVDLSQRRTAAQSDAFAQLILRTGAGHIAFRARPVQAAAFVVLKSPDMPSVLFEAGYISNPADAARLRSAAGKAAFADVTAQAIRLYFARAAGAEGAGLEGAGVEGAGA